MDELSPLYQEIEFRERLRGYDPDEVDAYVDRVAKAAALVQGRLGALTERAEAAEARLAEGGTSEAERTLTRTLVLAQRTADAAIAEATEEAEALLDGAKARAADSVSSAEEQAAATLEAAETEASELLKSSENRATMIVAEAETDRRTMVAEAESVASRAASDEKDRLSNEVADLQLAREFLADDVEILERHLSEQRHRIAATLSAVTDLLERPEAFRPSPAPATSGVEADTDVVDLTESVVDEIEILDELTDVEIEDFGELVDTDTDTDVDFDADDDAEAAALVAEEFAPGPPPETQNDDESELEVLDLSDSSEWAEQQESDDFAPEEEAPAPVIELDDAEDDDEPESTDGETTTIDLDSEAHREEINLTDPPEADESEGGDLADVTAGDSGNPPRLVTAADVGPSPQGAEGLVSGGPPTAPIPTIEETSLFTESQTPEEDMFLSQLRDAVASDDVLANDDDALSAFFDQEDDEGGRSWFGRRR